MANISRAHRLLEISGLSAIGVVETPGTADLGPGDEEDTDDTEDRHRTSLKSSRGFVYGTGRTQRSLGRDK